MAKDIASLCDEYRENKRIIEELEAMNEALKADIIAAMPSGVEVAVFGSNKVSNKVVCGSRFDSSAFKAVYSDLYKQYCKDYKYTRFSIA